MNKRVREEQRERERESEREEQREREREKESWRMTDSSCALESVCTSVFQIYEKQK